jgi:integrase
LTEKNPQRRRTRDLSKFLKNRPKNTIQSYRGAVVRFLNFIFDVDETRRHGPRKTDPVDMEFYDQLSLEYLNGERDTFDFGDDLRDFIRASSGLSPKTLGIYKSVVLSWLGENHIYLPTQMTRRVKAGGRAQTRDRIPTVGELRRILSHGDLHMKALILTLSSSGMRPGEALAITWDNVDLDRRHIFIPAEITKTKEARDVFVSAECVEVLSEWREYHSQYVEKVDAFTWQEDFVRNPDLVFPATYDSTRSKFSRILERAGLDERDPTTGRRILHLHGMRKFFRTRLPQGGCPLDVVELLLGHTGYLSDSYVRLTPEDLERAYREAEHELWIYRTKPINEGQLKQLESENQELRGELADIQRQLATMNAMQASIAGDPEALQELVDKRIKALVGEGES